MDLVDITEKLKEEQELTNLKLDSILLEFQDFVAQLARDKLDLLETQGEKDSTPAPDTKTPKNKDKEDEEEPSFLMKMLKGLGGLALAGLIYNSVRESLNLPSLKDLMSGTFNVVGDLITDAAKKALLPYEEGETTFSQENPEAMSAAQAAALSGVNVAQALTPDAPRRTLRGYTVGDVFEGADGRRFEVLDSIDGDPNKPLRTKQVPVVTALRGTSAEDAARFSQMIAEGKMPGTRASRIASAFDAVTSPSNIGNLVQKIPVPLAKTAGTVVKSIPAIGTAATVGLVGLEKMSVEDKMKVELRKMYPDADQALIDSVANSIAKKSAFAYGAGSLADLPKDLADLFVRAANVAGAGSLESSEEYRNFVPSAAASEVAQIYQLGQVRELGLEEYNRAQQRRESMRPSVLGLGDISSLSSRRMEQGSELDQQPSTAPTQNIQVNVDNSTNTNSGGNVTNVSNDAAMDMATYYLNSALDPYAMGAR